MFLSIMKQSTILFVVHKKSLSPQEYILKLIPIQVLSIGGAFAVEVVITAILTALIMALTDDGNGVPRGPLAPLLIEYLDSRYWWCYGDH